MLLEEMTWSDAAAAIERDAIIVIPAGSIEQHGHHLPLGTDSFTAMELAQRLAETRDMVIAPTLVYAAHARPAAGGGGPGFPGSIGVPMRVVADLVEAIVGDLFRQGFRRLVVLNAHFENLAPVTDALAEVVPTCQDARALLLTWTDVVTGEDLEDIGFPAPGGFEDWAVEHAATTETSFIKCFRPELVRDEFSGVGGVDRRATYEMFPLPPDLVPSSGMMGDAQQASAEFGERLTRLVVDRLGEAIDRELGVSA
jgi:creatinine amidohydrolase